MSDLRMRIIGDASSAKTALDTVAESAEKTAKKIETSFHHVGSIIKKTIGVTALGVGLEHALESASELVNLQKVQAKILDNAKLASQYQLKTEGERGKKAEEATRWYSKILDQQATSISLENGIAKAQVVRTQTMLLQNADLRKMYNGNLGTMKQMVDTAANLSELMGGGGSSIVGSARMLNRLMADPAKNLSAMRRYGVTLSKAEQDAIKAAQEGAGGLIAGQRKALEILQKEIGGVAKAAASPVELLKNLYQNVMLSLGQGLIPILESLANSLIPPVQALLPVLEFMGNTIAIVAEKLGTSLGNIIADLTPLFTLLTNSVIPALLEVVTPLIEMVDAALAPIVKVFTQMVGTADHLGPLAKVFQQMGESTSKALQPAIKSIGDTFKQMASNGTLRDLFQALTDSMIALAPILPSVAGAFTAIVQALAPILVETGPDLVIIIQEWTKLLEKIVPVITGAIDSLGGLADKVGGMSGIIGPLLAVWFTKKLFITPVLATIEALGKLGTKTVSVVGAMKGIGGAVKNIFGKGSFTGGRAEYWESKVAGARTTAENYAGMFGTNSTKYQRAHAEMEAFEKKSRKWGAIQAQGGGLKGMFKAFFGFGLKGAEGIAGAGAGGGGMNAGAFMNPIEYNTQALIRLTTAIEGLTGRFGYGGTGGSPMGTPVSIRGRGGLGDTTLTGGYTGTGGINVIEDDIASVAKKSGRFSKFFGRFKRFGKIGRLGRLAGRFGGRLGGMAMGAFDAFLGGGSGFDMLANGALNGLGSGSGAGVSAIARTPQEQEMVEALLKYKSGDKSALEALRIRADRQGGNAFTQMESLQQQMADQLSNNLGDKATDKLMDKYGKKSESVAKKSSLKVFSKLKGKAGSAMMKVGKKLAGGVFKKVGVAVAEQGAKWAAAEGIAAALGPETLGMSEVVVNGALLAKTVWDKRKTLMKWGGTALKFGGGLLKKSAGIVGKVGGFLGGLFGGGDSDSGGSGARGLLSKLGGSISKYAPVLGATMKSVGARMFNYFASGFLTAGSAQGFAGALQNLAGGMGRSGRRVRRFHSGGIVPGARGSEVPAILQAGEAVLSLGQMNAMGGGGNTLNVHPGAVNITVNGNADSVAVAEIKHHVEAQFKELHRTLKSMGR